MKLGAQFYTVRDYTKDLAGLEESLKRVADIGYETVQISGTCDFEPEWMRDTLKKCGLTCAVTHTDRDRVMKDPAAVAADHKVFGCKYIGIGAMPMKDQGILTDEDYDAFKKNFKDTGRIIAENGGYFMFHNHNREFAKARDGKIFMEHVIEEFSRDELGIILDTYWVQAGGADVVAWINKLSGRIPCVHLKDMGIVGHDPIMLPVGEGNLNMEAIVRACADAKTEYLLVEQDDCNGENPFDCLKRSYDYLKGLGL